MGALGDLVGPRMLLGTWLALGCLRGDLAGSGLLEDSWLLMGVLRDLGWSWGGLEGG